MVLAQTDLVLVAAIGHVAKRLCEDDMAVGRLFWGDVHLKRGPAAKS